MRGFIAVMVGLCAVIQTLVIQAGSEDSLVLPQMDVTVDQLSNQYTEINSKKYKLRNQRS